MFGRVVEELEGLCEAGLATAFAELELQRRQVEASLAVVVDLVGRRGAFRADGHRSVRGWVKAQANCPDADANHLVRLGQLVREIPEAGDRLHNGDVGIAQIRELARVHRNPRCGDQLPEAASTLLRHAMTRPFSEYKQIVARWVLVTDPEGSFKDHELNHHTRTASLHNDDSGLFLRADGGTAGLAAELLEIFERFCHAEFLTDWDAAVGEHGEAANASHMARTSAQRRFDAVAAIFKAASTAPLDGRVPEPTVNFCIDQHTFEEYVNRKHNPTSTTSAVNEAVRQLFGNNNTHDADSTDDPGDNNDRSDARNDTPHVATISSSGGSEHNSDHSGPGARTPQRPPPHDDHASSPDDADHHHQVSNPAFSSPESDVIDPLRRRCETVGGILLQPDEIFAAMLIGHVRRVVYDSAGNIIDLGRRRRLFTGTARQAVLLQTQRCIWPGCDITAQRCQADHATPWATGGTTTPTNGTPACGHHNRTKNQGFTTRQNTDGTWHVYRPDGTELTQPPAKRHAA